MFKLIGLVVSLLCLNACAHYGEQGVVSDKGTPFFHAGYQFYGVIEGDTVRVSVPCCQSYIADDAFKSLMLEAVLNWLRCEPNKPVFTEGWVGPWQLMAVFDCAVMMPSSYNQV